MNEDNKMLAVKKMMNRTILLCGLFLLSSSLFSQNNFSIRWNVYEEGVIVEENPFNGSFIIQNVGESTILTGDTIWYGYLVEDEVYDLNFNLSLYSGMVLDEDFAPGDEFSVSNVFEWPLFWESGDTVSTCATVYGEGIESYLEIPYTGDDDPSNNLTCVQAILPTYTAEINSIDLINRIYHANDRLFIEISQKNVRTSITIYSLTGSLVLNQVFEDVDGKIELATDLFIRGLYTIVIEQNHQIEHAKFVF